MIRVSFLILGRLKPDFLTIYKTNMAENASSFKPSLSLVDATMVVAGSMIGSGIFIVTSDITRNVGSAGWIDCRLADHWFHDHHRCRKLWRAEWHVSQKPGAICLFKRSI